MYGAIIGDIVGSKYEFDKILTKDFPLISKGCMYTDDTVMTVAVAKALLRSLEEQRPFKPILVEEMQKLGRAYPDAGYGGMFFAWLYEDEPQPYYSYGNGSAMRVSPCGLIAVTLEEALALAKASAEVTHNHPEGIKGAQATAAAVFLAKSGADKETIRDCIRQRFYPLDETLEEIRPHYLDFYVSCQESVPQAIQCFLESESYEDAIRNAVSLGSDSDTQGAIAGGIAWAYYRNRPELSGPETGKKPGRPWPERCARLIEDNDIDALLPEEFREMIERLDAACAERSAAYAQTGTCTPIPIE